MGPAERALLDRGIPLQPLVFDYPEQDTGQQGFMWIAPFDGGFDVSALVREDADYESRESFAEWALSRFNRFEEHGPEPDGWQKRQLDGAWQLAARRHLLPDI